MCVDGVVAPGVIDGEAGGGGTSSVGALGGTSRAAGTGWRVGAREGTVPQADSSKSKLRAVRGSALRCTLNKRLRRRKLGGVAAGCSSHRPIDNKRHTATKVFISEIESGMAVFLVKVFLQVLRCSGVSTGGLFLEGCCCGVLGLGVFGCPGVISGAGAPPIAAAQQGQGGQ